MTEAALVTRSFFLVVTVLLGAVLFALPALTRPGLFFAVTIDPALRAQPLGRRVTMIYRVIIAAATLIALVVGLGFDPHTQSDLLAWPVVGLVVAALLAFLWCRSRILPHAIPAATAREASLVPLARVLPGGSVVQAFPFAAMLAVAGWLVLEWRHIPAHIPVEWGSMGSAETVIPKSPSTVFGPLLSGTFGCLLMLALAVGLLLWSRRIAARGPAAVQEGRFRQLVLVVLLAAEYIIALQAALTASRPLIGQRAESWMLPSIFVLSAIFLVVLIIAFMRSGQGGSRLPVDGANEAAPVVVGDGTHDRLWKAGLFYVNSNDPSLLVEKRFGIGYTLNFGNIWSWVIIALIVGGIAAHLYFR